MRYRKSHTVFLIIILCIAANVAGKTLAHKLELPVWLDSFGTMFAAYAYGPVCGAIVGFTVNIICNFSRPLYMVYAVTSVLIGIVTGILARKKMLENLFGLLTTGFVLAMVSVAVSTPLNCIFFHGYTDNKWGDGVIDMLREHGVNTGVSFVVGEYYVDFIDKVITLAALYLAILLVRRVNDRGGKQIPKAFLLGVAAAWVLAPAALTEAARLDGNEYSSWMQTVYDAKNGLPGGAVNDITQTEDGVLWVGTYGGVYRYNGNGFKLMNHFESVKNVNCFYTDNEGRLWIGTNDSGLSICINSEIANVIDEESGLPSNSVRCIKEGADGNFYVGTTGSLAIVNLSSGLTVVETIPEITYSRSIAMSRDGYAAVVTDEGMFFFAGRVDDPAAGGFWDTGGKLHLRGLYGKR